MTTNNDSWLPKPDQIDDVYKAFINRDFPSKWAEVSPQRVAFKLSADYESRLVMKDAVDLARATQMQAYVSAQKPRQPKRPTNHILFKMQRRDARKLAKAFRLFRDEFFPRFQEILLGYTLYGENYDPKKANRGHGGIL